MVTQQINRLAFFSIIWLILCLGCSNDLDVTNPGDPIPVIFCVVDPEDSFCYVTISKSFSTESNAVDVLKDGSRLKVDDARITLEAWGSGYKLWETGFSLVKDTLPYNELQAGARSCYRSDKELLFNDFLVFRRLSKSNFKEWRLQVSSPQLKEIAYSRIPILYKPLVIYPTHGMALDLYRTERSVFSCFADRDHVRYISFVCDFYYREYINHWEDKCSHFVVHKNTAWQLIDPVRDSLKVRLYEEFFNQIAVALPDDPSINAREFRYMDFKIVVGDEYMNDYCDTYLNAATHDMSAYTNIVNGFGLFSVKRRGEFPSITFERQSMDSLIHGRLTRNLHFVEW